MCSYLAKGKCNSFLPVEQPELYPLSEDYLKNSLQYSVFLSASTGTIRQI